MMNQYHHHHPQTYTNFPSQHHFHVSSTTTATTSPSTNYNYSSFYDPSIIENSYEQYSIDNSTAIQSFDQCQNYSNNLQLTNHQPYSDFSLSNNQQSQIIEQSSTDQKPIINEAKYKWMEIKRAPPKTSGIVLKYISSDKNPQKNDE
jgi:hypothetical protein